MLKGDKLQLLKFYITGHILKGGIKEAEIESGDWFCYLGARKSNRIH